MYTKEDLINCLSDMRIDPKGTVLVHSSMKAIGEVEGGADTVLDAFSEYMRDGLLALLRRSREQAEAELESKGRVYRSVGYLCGAALLLLVI